MRAHACSPHSARPPRHTDLVGAFPSHCLDLCGSAAHLHTEAPEQRCTRIAKVAARVQQNYPCSRHIRQTPCIVTMCIVQPHRPQQLGASVWSSEGARPSLPFSPARATPPHWHSALADSTGTPTERRQGLPAVGNVTRSFTRAGYVRWQPGQGLSFCPHRCRCSSASGPPHLREVA